MLAAASRLLDRVRGRGAAASTVPPMDGVLRPNTRLETAEVLLRIGGPGNLVKTAEGIFFSSGPDVFKLDSRSGAAVKVRTLDAEIACLAPSGQGLFAAGTCAGRIELWGRQGSSRSITMLGGERLVCPTALAFEDDATLLVCQGSCLRPPDQWKTDLMQRTACGSVWRLPLSGGTARRLADGLAYPNGLIVIEGGLIVAESWRHRLIRLWGERIDSVLSDLPGYPAQIASDGEGGYLLSVFAPRSQLIEFVLRERTFRERMMRELHSDHWIAPSLFSARSYLEPLQGGGVITHGALKPWAPTRSYGLVIRLDANLQPVDSFHSRADGKRHGVTSCIADDDGFMVAASNGGDAVLRLPMRAKAGET